MRLITLTIFAVMLLALSVPASASVGLADWCVNLNGSINVCNGASAPVGTFDRTLESVGPNTLGSITVSIGTGAQYAAVYMDYDVNYDPRGSFADSGATGGTQAGTQSWELDDPNTSNIFALFAAGTLANTNNVGAPSIPPNECCDVSWALAEKLNVDAALYSGGIVTFTASTTAPTSGFYLKQTNQYSGDSIYLSDAVSLTPLGGAAPVPEPASVVLLATLIGGVLFVRKRSIANAA